MTDTRIYQSTLQWENSLKNQAVPAVELNWQFASFSNVIRELSIQALLARVSIPICGAVHIILPNYKVPVI